MEPSLLDFAGQALLQLLTGPHLLFLLLGVLLGLSVGLLPGLGGISGMALVLPFVYGMDQGPALAMMIGLTSVTTTSDTFPSVLLGVPGSSGSQATVVDGFPLAKQGEAARALAAAFLASLCGGVFGAILLSFAFVIARPMLLAVGFGEQLMLVLLALTLVGMLTGASMLKGLASCGIGLLIGTIGASTATAEYRMTFGSLYLADGIPLVIVGLGIFAVPEILDVLRHQRTIAERGVLGSGWRRGVLDVIRHKWLVLRCATIGALVGALPGLGGTVIDWIAYGHVVQTSRDKSGFGKGDIRGVIAPESANNAKEGGALIPTLFLGIPGSGSMALLLGGLVLIGLTPGRSMVTDHVDLVYVIIWSIALANIIGAGICIGLVRPIAALTAVPYTLIAPFMIVLIFFAAFQASEAWGDLVTLLAVGILGVFMKRFGWSRAALLIGFVLSSRLEASLYRTVQIYGLEVLLRPLSLVLLAVAVASGYIAWRARTAVAGADEASTRASTEHRRDQLAFALFLAAFVAVVVIDASGLRFLASVFPLSVSAVTGVMLLATIAMMILRSDAPHLLYDSEAELRARGVEARPMIFYFAWLAGVPALTALIGFFLAAPIFVAAFLRTMAKTSIANALIGAGVVATLLWVLADVLVLRYPEGWLQNYVQIARYLAG